MVWTELAELLDWIDAYFYDSIPKLDLRARLAPILDHADPTSGECCHDHDDPV